MHSELSWTSASPGDVAKALFAPGVQYPMHGGAFNRPLAGQMAIGFAQGSSRPSLIVVAEQEAIELLAWVATYTPEAFPFTQTARVVSVRDWEISSKRDSAQRRAGPDLIWSSVILGELLSQGDSGSGIERAPIARAMSCFSFAMARAARLYEDSDAYGQVARRLEKLESASLFHRRTVSLKELLKVWRGIDGTESPQVPHLRETIKTVMAALDQSSLNHWIRAGSEFERLEVDISRMSSGPIEQRVIEFEHASASLLELCRTSPDYQERAPMYLAAFALWVGAGTSHISLLDEFSAQFPAVFAWFGLYAGLAGPAAWDGKWLRGASAVDRFIRAPFAVDDPPTADLSWLEYELISSQKHPAAWIQELPKLSPRALTVELFAGVTCQLRLGETHDGDVVTPQPIRSKSKKAPAGPRQLTAEDWDRVNQAAVLLRSIGATGIVGEEESGKQVDLFSPQRPRGQSGGSKKKANSRSPK
jgi:hypothetical protein